MDHDGDGPPQYLNTQIPIDLTIFKNLESNDCKINELNDNIKHNNSIENCDCMKRIAMGLKYYQFVCDKTIESEQFINFCQEIYCNLLDDYCHFIKHHQQQLNQIKIELETKCSLKECNINECIMMERHYRTERGHRERKDVEDATYSFYSDVFDTIHHQIFHIDRLGLRFHKKDDDNQEIKDVDRLFKTMKDFIFKKREQNGSDRFKRLRVENNKFNLMINDDNSKLWSDSICFLDKAFENIPNDIDVEMIEKLKLFLRLNQYDTDAFLYDLKDKLQESNIINVCNDENYIVYIQHFIYQFQSYVTYWYPCTQTNHNTVI